ncbi:hypothetical protein [Microcoleus sp. CAWBG51]|uniref:hypothetical protein n=1 Tax=Microcoleus sp. CAWBG51 TaxID=2841648 RepID=UPI0025E752ED|nr:hypothetical protein [Microcoleus sp. CAWBG51]
MVDRATSPRAKCDRFVVRTEVRSLSADFSPHYELHYEPRLLWQSSGHDMTPQPPLNSHTP